MRGVPIKRYDHDRVDPLDLMFFRFQDTVKAALSQRQPTIPGKLSMDFLAGSFIEMIIHSDWITRIIRKNHQ